MPLQHPRLLSHTLRLYTRAHRLHTRYCSTPLIIRSRFHRTAKMTSNDVETPPRCYADFCLVPVGTGNVSVAEEVAAVQRLLKTSGLKYTMHSAGTTVEGSWNEVMKVIGQAHTVVHREGVQRVQTSMRVGTRTDKTQTAEDKVKRVEDLLSKGE
ncbi:YkoF-like protein [Immersiella caudata]|uniref:YkoF-like protein n=1 Tax=Immersiella caudata TaxID=314043 RepID=A0AA40C3E9_9PEZI|nr:YkoF-like protein [Immersiella caudata]